MEKKIIQEMRMCDPEEDGLINPKCNKSII